MARPLRVEFPGAIYHVTSRGDGKRAIFRDERDYQRLCDGLAHVVDRLGWELFSFVLTPHQFHLLLRTPRPNLSRGMQQLGSGYANWCGRRRGRSGRTFRGRFKVHLIEDESYFWSLSRYIHLNPVRGKRPLVAHPRDWPWSSYAGYDRRRRRVKWVAYDALYSASRGESGGGDPETAYRRYVGQGIKSPPENPFRAAAHGWLVGSPRFLNRIRSLMSRPKNPGKVPASRRMAALEPAIVLAAVALYYGVDQDDFQRRRSGELSRDVAAWMARRLTAATLRELAPAFGVSTADSVHNLVRRVDLALAASRTVAKDIEKIRRDLLLSKTENSD
jgi:putative transposase